MIKILIISLTRMGDLLQASPLIAALKKKHSAVTLDVLVSSDFVQVAKSIPNIDGVKIFNLKQFTPLKNTTGVEKGQDKAYSKEPASSEYKKEVDLVIIYRYVEGIIDDLQKSNYDMVINLSHSKLSAIITSLINVQDIRGITSSGFGHRMIKHPWLRYFATILFNRAYNSFNLVDVYLKTGDVKSTEEHLLLKVDKESIKFSDELLLKNGVSKNDFLVGFQPGANLMERRWPAKSFANLGNRIINDLNGKVVLFGVESEAELGLEIEKMIKGKIINTIGKTSIQQLTALVKKCSTLVSNDTGTMHIATAMGTRVVGLFFAHAFPIETGPYSSGNIVFQANIPCSPCSYGVKCNNVVCVNHVKSDHLFQVLKLIKNGEVDNTFFENNVGMEKIKIFRSAFDQDHILEFLPIIKRPLTKQEFFRFVYRMMWKITLDQTSKTLEENFLDKKEEKNIIIKLNTYYNLDEFPKIYPQITATMNEFNKLWEITKQASRLTEKLIKATSSNSQDLNKIQSFGEKIAKLDEKIHLMALTNPTIKPIIDIFLLGKENLQGDIIAILAKETLSLYKDMKHQAGFIYRTGSQLCESIVDLKKTNLKYIKGTSKK